MAQKTTTRRHATHITTPTGKRVYLSGGSKEVLDAKLLQTQLAICAGVDPTAGDTFAEYAEQWLKAYKKGKKRESSVAVVRNTLYNHLIPAFGEIRLKDIRHMHVQSFLGEISGYSKSLQSKCFGLLRRILQAAVDDNLIIKTPVRKDDKIEAEDPDEEEPLTNEQARALLAAVQGTQAYTFCLIALSTGMRRGEILGLMWDDVDLDNGLIHVRHNKSYPMNKDDAPVTDNLKTKAARRDLPIGGLLSRHLAELRIAAKSSYVICMGNRKSLTRSAFRSMWQIVERRTAGKGSVQRELGESYGGMQVTLDFDVHPHLLRHTYITQLFEAGLDLKQVQYLAGHSKPEMTMRVYTHYRKKQRAAETQAQVCAAVDYLQSSDCCQPECEREEIDNICCQNPAAS